ncbi:MAG: indole-3-glycerol phosphate synthase TrpC [Candidatus Hydrogenedentes bacterium]|nr:indole-3-glycerol phosphate synthase TrpC [Candidatus Hydrogenedentota bacterium]
MILDEIVLHKREELRHLQSERPLAVLEEKLDYVKPPRDFRAALRQDGISLIAEIKRKSPSKGDMLPGVEAVELGALYEQAGARAISILTDKKFFDGTIDDLTTVQRTVHVPCLRKEFIIDPYQIYEARAGAADAILLIVRILDDAQLRDFLALSRELGMEPLVETHNEEEIDRAIEAGAHIIGINNRDLDTLKMDLETTERLRKRVPGGKTLVSESGIYTREHVKRLEAGGIDGILVGESLLTSKNIKAKIQELLGHDES